jgi:hypothetical protein
MMIIQATLDDAKLGSIHEIVFDLYFSLSLVVFRSNTLPNRRASRASGQMDCTIRDADNSRARSN